MIPKRLLVGMATFLCLPLFLLAQDRTITGKVTDPKDGSPVAGASVMVKNNSNIGTSSATDGSFKLTVPPDATTLVISAVGFTSQEVDITGKTTVNVSLAASLSNALNEVVVIGYGTTRKKDLTGSVAVINAKDFQKGAITTPEQLIAGKVAGVQISSNGGAPGAGSRIRIRGGSSLNASNDPLIVIDGVPIENYLKPDGTSAIAGSPNPLSLINPNDIESFNILKDASATAIYGSRASNGVIIITTKKGKSGKPVFNFVTQLSAANNPENVEVLTAVQFREVVNAKGSTAQKALLGSANTDWQDEIYQTAVANDNNGSVSGSLGKMPYRVSLGYLNQNGILKTGYLKRTTAGINIGPRLFADHLKIDLSLKGVVSKSRFADQGAIGAAVIFDPTKPVHSGSKRFGGFYEWIDPATGLPNTLTARNPVGLLEQRDDKGTVQRSIGNAQLDYKFHFLPDLHANLNVGYDVSKGEGTIYVPDSAASQYSRKGTNKEYLQKKQNSLLEFYLNYTKDLAAINSRVDVVAGYSYNDFLTTEYSFADYNARGEKIPNSDPKFAFDKPRNTLISYFGRLNFAYNDRYLLTASLRRDGSSRFAPEHRWGLFPALALAWKIKGEDFMKTLTAVSDLKLRLGYGITGQQEGIGNYDYISYYALSTETARYQLGDTLYNSYRPGGYYSSRKWEQTTTYNVGLDFGFAGNRITGSIDYYFKKTKDLLNEINQPAGTNFSNRIIANVGNMENSGVEFNINTQPVRNSSFTWDFNFNITYNKNKITNLTLAPDSTYPGNQTGGISGGTGNTIQINSVGYPRGSFYVYQQAYDQNGKPLESLFIDRNKDGFINEKDLYQYKNPDPRVFIGISTNVTYQKWNAGFVMRGSFGNYMYNNVYSNLGRYSTIASLPNLLNNASVNYLETQFAGGDVRQALSDYYVQNASFLRMDNINFGYNAGALFSKVNVRVNVNVQNVFVITKYKGLDPEINTGIDNNFYPRPRTFVIGLNLDF
jgi:TonB-dependent starch-binding outer membrane protein SusC